MQFGWQLSDNTVLSVGCQPNLLFIDRSTKKPDPTTTIFATKCHDPLTKSNFAKRFFHPYRTVTDDGCASAVSSVRHRNRSPISSPPTYTIGMRKS